MSARIHPLRSAALASLLGAVLSMPALAQPSTSIIPIGSPLTFGGTNAPDTFTAVTTFSSTPVLADNGAVQIWQQQVPTGATGEWDVFYLKTVNGGPLAGNTGGLWNITMSYVLSAPVYFDQVADQWLVNGTPVSPLTNGIGSICCAVATNPILPGWAYYNSGFSGALSAGTQSNWQQVYVTPYSYVSSGGINPNTANQFIFALHFTLQGAVPSVTGVISAGQFGGFPSFAPGSWIEIYGTNLAAAPQTWAASDFNGVIAPTKLAGTSTTVTIGGVAAFIDYVSPSQVNVQVPGGIATGAQSLVVTTSVGSTTAYPASVNATQPGLLAPSTFQVAGTQYVTAQFPDGTYVAPPGSIAGVTSKRAKSGDTITIYGIGFGSVTPNIPPGQIVEQLNSLTNSLTVSIGGAPATVQYDGLAENYLGLYQFNVVVPSVTVSDSVPFTFKLNGTSGTQTLAIAVGN